jgi:hypothetical protein
MQVGNVELLYFIDYLNKRIHLMDRTSVGQITLVNTIDPTFQQKMIEQEQLLRDIIDFEWICYGSDGFISSYSNYNFKVLNSKLPYLYKPYLDEVWRNKKR